MAGAECRHRSRLCRDDCADRSRARPGLGPRTLLRRGHARGARQRDGRRTRASSSSAKASESAAGTSRTTAGLFDKYGAERLCDTPICERGFVGLGGGAAMTGTRPVIDFMFTDFIIDAFGEIINQIAKMQYMSSGRLKMPILLRGCIGIGHSAATHHSGSYHSIFSHIPGLRVVVPSTPYDAKGLFTHALRCDDPVLFLEQRELLSIKGPVPAESYEIEFGKARVLREGNHVTVVGIGVMAQRALDRG